METTLITIDRLAGICGYSNSNTPVNNHNGCDHKKCSESDIVKIVQKGGKFEQIELMVTPEKYIQTEMVKNICQNREAAIEIYRNDKISKNYFKKLFEDPTNPIFLKTLGLKKQGKCYSFTCPLAYEAGEEDFIEHGEDPELMGDDWIVIETEKLKNL